MREPGRIFSRTQLCERVWEREHGSGLKLVEAYISRLRKKINSPPLIHTVDIWATRLGTGMKNWPLRWKIAHYSRGACRSRNPWRRNDHLVRHALCRDRGF